jgi:hypothetical protein
MLLCPTIGFVTYGVFNLYNDMFTPFHDLIGYIFATLITLMNYDVMLIGLL